MAALTDEAKRLLALAHEGFKITCLKCGCEDIKFNNTMGFSGQSGSWGSFDMNCTNCRNSVQLIGN